MTEISHGAADAVGAASPLLEVAGVGMRFGGIVALDEVTFRIARGRIVGLIGPNGAGKTTLFNCLSRLYRPGRGDIRLNGRSLANARLPTSPRSELDAHSRPPPCSRRCRSSTT